LRRSRVEPGIVPDEQVEEAVSIEVRKGAGGSPRLRLQSGLSRHVPEAFACLVVQQQSGAIAADVEIVIAVVVVVADRAAEKMAGELVQPGRLRHIAEMAVSIALVESELGADEQNIEVAVVVVVQEGTAVADGLQNGERTLAWNLPAIIQPGFLGDFAKQQASSAFDRRGSLTGDRRRRGLLRGKRGGRRRRVFMGAARGCE